MKEDIAKALEVLKNGGVILYPTDTIWGLGCDATNEEAVKRIHAIKGSSDAKSMLVLLDNEARIASYADVPDIAYDLWDVADKPLTIIYPSAKNLASNLIAEDGSIGIRITKETFSQQLIQKFKKPVVSTSANIHGSKSPLIFDEIDEEIKQKVDFIVHYRQDDINKSQPSGIIKLGLGGQIKVIRE